ncbi:hypothetical protein GCM10010211_28610 [Streptomyces albospinus]|uniref:Uncharacterized protein n=1 Tax=Streptomyces albospinus TaxID=285515 RepID=A0ABQ2V2M3_9ACTN|nr:hypothetical protein [Streptomyces albospinus]GGU61860.1 hypothetical protein GCM10010211_28610 [Streptomyces albospinus]
MVHKPPDELPPPVPAVPGARPREQPRDAVVVGHCYGLLPALGALTQPPRLTGAVAARPATGIFCTAGGTSIATAEAPVSTGDPRFAILTEPQGASSTWTPGTTRCGPGPTS